MQENELQIERGEGEGEKARQASIITSMAYSLFGNHIP
jgi:hypothetical protein